MTNKEKELNIDKLEAEYSELRRLGIEEERQEEIRNIIYYYEKGKTQTLKDEIKWLKELNKRISLERFGNYSKNDVDFIMIHKRIKELLSSLEDLENNSQDLVATNRENITNSPLDTRNGCGKEWSIDEDPNLYICGKEYNTYNIKGKYICPECKKYGKARGEKK